MERLTFINPLGQAVEFSAYSKYRWLNVDGLGGSTAESQVTVSPYQDGSTPVGDAYFSARTVRLDLVIISNTLSDEIRDLNNKLNPKLGLATLKYERDGRVFVLNKVRTQMLPTLPGAGSRGLTFQLSSLIFEVFDPYYSDEQYTDAEVVTGGSSLEFPVNITDTMVFDYLNSTGITVSNNGDVDCPVTVILDGPKSSPLEIENMTTGEKIVVTMALLDGERLTITTDIDNINVVKTVISTGAETVAFQYIDVEQTSFFYLLRGSNTLKISAGEAEIEEATIRFKPRYVGV